MQSDISFFNSIFGLFIFVFFVDFLHLLSPVCKMISIIRSEFKSLFRIYYIGVNNNKNRTEITPFYHNNDTSFLRWFSSSSSKELDEKTYEELVNKTLDNLNDHFEQFFEQIDDKNCDITFNVSRIFEKVFLIINFQMF